jgi:hypothetical protein
MTIEEKLTAIDRAIYTLLKDAAQAASLTTSQGRQEILEKQKLIARGCYRCGNPVEDGSYRREVKLVRPCSEGSMMQNFIICSGCFDKIYGFLSGDSID